MTFNPRAPHTHNPFLWTVMGAASPKHQLYHTVQTFILYRSLNWPAGTIRGMLAIPKKYIHIAMAVPASSWHISLRSSEFELLATSPAAVQQTLLATRVIDQIFPKPIATRWPHFDISMTWYKKAETRWSSGRLLTAGRHCGLWFAYLCSRVIRQSVVVCASCEE